MSDQERWEIVRKVAREMANITHPSSSLMFYWNIELQRAIQLYPTPEDKSK